MALIEDSGKITYVTIFDGVFEVKVKEGTPNAVSRKNKNDETIHVLVYKGVSGIITDIKKEITDYKGKKFSSLKVFLTDEDETTVLSLPYNSSMTSAFYHMVENIDLDKPVVFSASKDKEKDRTSLFISQDKNNVKWKYTKAWAEANPNLPQKPQWVKKMVKGEEVWDNTDEILFFENIMRTKILPVLRAKKEQAAETPADAFAKDNNVAQKPEQLIQIPAAQPDPSIPDMEDIPF